MKLADESRARIERFLREHLKDEALRLPALIIYRGALARLLTETFKIGAITFGRHVFISPKLVRAAPDGRQIVPGWLVAHEAVHVLQYEQEGFVRFLFGYVLEYFRLLRASGGWDAAARMAAYLAIRKECAAREAEEAYQVWTGRSEGDF